MTELYPTPTRLALLRDVADGHVHKVVGGYWNSSTRRQVTASMYDFYAAGWVDLPPRGVNEPVALADAGRAVLDTHGGAKQ